MYKRQTNSKTVWAYSSEEIGGTNQTGKVAIEGEITGIYYNSTDVMTPSSLQLDNDENVQFKLSSSDVQFAFSIYGDYQVGDKIVAIDGSHIFSTTDLIYKLQTTDKASYDVTVKRNGAKLTIENVTFHNDKTDGLLDFAVQGKAKNPVTVISYAAKDTVATAKLIWMSLIEPVSYTHLTLPTICSV